MATLQRRQSLAWEEVAASPQPIAQGETLSYERYLWRVLLIPALLYPIAFLLVCMPSYEHWATSQWGPMLEYPFDTHANADVVLFGDSSAFLGIDPRIVDAQLGIKSVVLPDTVGSIPVTGDRPLAAYLAHNRRPRLIVFYFSAWNLDFAHTATGRLFEGEEMMFRHMDAREISVFGLQHPFEMIEFPFRLYSTFGPKMVSSVWHHVDREKITAEALGHADYTEPFPPLNGSCQIPANYLANIGSDSVRELVRRYTTPGTRVMVYLAPIPSCSNSAKVLARSFVGVGAVPPKPLPAASFAGDPYYAHVLPDSVRASSILFANALKNHLQ